MKKALALAMLALATLSSAAPALAHVRRHRHVHAHVRVWAGRRIVAAQPVPAAAVVINGRPHGVIDLDVEPEETKVYVNGEFRGSVDDFDGAPGKLNLLPGSHRIKLEAPDGATWSEKVRVVAGHEINVKLELDED